MNRQPTPSVASAATPGRVYEYYATCVSGLEEVVAQDLRRRLPGIQALRAERGRRHGRLWFHYERSPRQLLDLRSVTNLFAAVARVTQVTTGRPGVVRVAEALAVSDLSTAVALYGKLHGLEGVGVVRIVSTVTPNHRFSPAEVIRAASQALPPPVAVTFGPGVQAPALHVTVEEHAAVCGLQLGRRRLRARQYRHAAVGGGLDATVAYCMALLAGIGSRTVCLDPMCGGGTLLVEGVQAFGARLGVGGDLSGQALDVARQNVREAGAAVCLVRWDATHLPVRAGSVDALLCNLPFGKRVEALARGHVPGVLAGTARVLRPGGRAVLLGHPQDLRAPVAPGLRQEQRLRLHLRGVDPVLVVLRRA
ncbi:MAG: methyltransferase domain-containing protein [Candidatus Latescibacterota bacterium]